MSKTAPERTYAATSLPNPWQQPRLDCAVAPFFKHDYRGLLPSRVAGRSPKDRRTRNMFGMSYPVSASFREVCEEETPPMLNFCVELSLLATALPSTMP